MNLEPFQRVLVRDHQNHRWSLDFFSHFNAMSDYSYVCLLNKWRFCVPYEGNEHLFDTNRATYERAKQDKKLSDAIYWLQRAQEDKQDENPIRMQEHIQKAIDILTRGE